MAKGQAGEHSARIWPGTERNTYFILVGSFTYPEVTPLAQCPAHVEHLCQEQGIDPAAFEWEYIAAEPAKVNEQLEVERRDRRTLYFIEAVGVGLVKIGISDNVQQRFEKLQCASPVPLRLLGTIADAGAETERDWHRDYAAFRSHAEWFTAIPGLRKSIAMLAKLEPNVTPESLGLTHEGDPIAWP
jgi:hypothetical protein